MRVTTVLSEVEMVHGPRHSGDACVPVRFKVQGQDLAAMQQRGHVMTHQSDERTVHHLEATVNPAGGD